MATTKQSVNSCCLVYGENSEFLVNLAKSLAGEKPVEDTQVVIFDGSVACVYTCELEIDSKYQFVRLRVILCDSIHALLTENCIRTAYQLHSDVRLPPVCSFVVVHHSAGGSENGNIEQAKQYVQSLITKWSPEGRILLGVPGFHTLESGSIQQKNDFAKWCVENQLEIVEMEGEAESESFNNDGREEEEYGPKRILSALAVAAAFVRDKSSDDGHQFQRLPSTSGSDDESETESNAEKHPSAANVSSSNQKTVEEAEQFDALFSRLVTMKERCQAMPEGSERHAYAEKVVTAFWKAIGGDEDELGSSSSGSPVSDSPASGSDVEELITDAGREGNIVQNGSEEA